MNVWFSRFSAWCARIIGHPLSFIAACVSVVVWAAFGPPTGYSDTWQLIINTGTTVLTFLMLFVLQSSQNRGERALQAKLDEVLRAIPEADDTLRGVEQEHG